MEHTPNTNPIPEEELTAAAIEETDLSEEAAAPVEDEVPPSETEEETPDERFARTEQEDLAALRTALPELGTMESLSSLTSPARYGELRELGLTPLEAYLASEGRSALAARQDSRAHLVSSIGRTAATGSRIGSAEMEAARELFPSLSDGEIEALWRRVENPRHR